jgi:DNA-binding GntR family transcriptional regulator
MEAKIQLIRIINCNLNVMKSDIQIHFQIIEAIEKHDSKNASSLMRKHIGDFINHASVSPKQKKTFPVISRDLSDGSLFAIQKEAVST